MKEVDSNFAQESDNSEGKASTFIETNIFSPDGRSNKLKEIFIVNDTIDTSKKMYNLFLNNGNNDVNKWNGIYNDINNSLCEYGQDSPNSPDSPDSPNLQDLELQDCINNKINNSDRPEIKLYMEEYFKKDIINIRNILLGTREDNRKLKKIRKSEKFIEYIPFICNLPFEKLNWDQESLLIGFKTQLSYLINNVKVEDKGFTFESNYDQPAFIMKNYDVPLSDLWINEIISLKYNSIDNKIYNLRSELFNLDCDGRTVMGGTCKNTKKNKEYNNKIKALKFLETINDIIDKDVTTTTPNSLREGIYGLNNVVKVGKDIIIKEFLEMTEKEKPKIKDTIINMLNEDFWKYGIENELNYGKILEYSKTFINFITWKIIPIIHNLSIDIQDTQYFKFMEKLEKFYNSLKPDIHNDIFMSILIRADHDNFINRPK